MRHHLLFGIVALALGAAATAAEYPIPEEFTGSYLANRSAAGCLRQERAGLATPSYLVVQPRSFRYGYLNPRDDNSLDAMVCRATRPVVVTGDSMEVHSECFMTDRLLTRHFRFTKRAGVLLLHDFERETDEEFESCF